MVNVVDNNQLNSQWEEFKVFFIKQWPRNRSVPFLRSNIFKPVDINNNIMVIMFKSNLNLESLHDDVAFMDNLKSWFKVNDVDLKKVQYFTDQERIDAENKKIADDLKLKESLKIEQDKINKQIMETRIRNSRIPLIAYKYKTFEKLEITPDNKSVVDICKNFVNSEKRQFWMLTLYGNTGTSKSHLAFAIGVETIKTKDVIYWQVAEMLDLLQSSQFDNSYKNIMDELKNTSLLILDDYADYKQTEFKQEKMDILIDYRYENCLDTVITTNKDLKDLVLFDQRIASRLMEHKTLQTKWGDYRLKKSGHTYESLLRGKQEGSNDWK